MRIRCKMMNVDGLQMELGRARLYDIPIILATGCFDILHRGHVELLEGAREMFPGHELWLGLNSDAAVRSLKGEGRPVHDYESRAIVMAGLLCVDVVFEIQDVRVANAIRAIRPRVWLKGGDYTLETLDQGERNAAEEVGSMIHLVPTVQGYSTTEILKKLEVAP